MALRKIIGFVAGCLCVLTSSAVAAPLYRVGFAQDTLDNDWRRAQVRTLEQTLAVYPDIEFSYTDAQGSTARQIAHIEDYIYKKVDLLVASPRDSRAMTPVISAAYQKGIPVILLTREIENSNYTVFISPDDAAIARAAARDLATALNGSGKILMLQGVPTASTAKKRTDAFLEEINHYPGLEIAAIKPANYLRSDAIQAVEEMLYSNQSFNAIYAQSDSMASGARIALKGAGIDPSSLPIVGIDYISEAREAIRQGEQRSSYIYPTCAEQAARVIRDILDGKPVAKRINVDSIRVDRSNVDAVEPIF